MKKKFRISGVILFIFIVYACKEKPTPPILATTAVTEISYTTATSGGNVTDEGGDLIIARGICWSTNTDPTISDNKTTESGTTGAFISNLTQLTPNTTYYIKAYATNSAGTGYGSQVSFKTLQVAVPAVTTTEITSITQTTATSGGNITTDNGSTITARGVCWSTSANPTTELATKTTDAGTIGTFMSSITGLTGNTTYYVRAYATNGVGTSYGDEINFKTNPLMPTLTTKSISDITQTTAASGGNVSSDGGSTVTARGVCWSTSQNPITSDSKTNNGTGTGVFTSSITELAENTLYYIRAYATNSVGTNYGTELSFKTLKSGQIMDIDGNVYNTIIIGTQTWMVENLMTTKYNNGTSIPYYTDLTISHFWISEFDPGYCWYNNDSATYKATYGALYNWYAVNTGFLCPTRWHVPTDTEWTTLTTYLGGESVAGGKLKETGIAHWLSPNTGATNESGFTGLPGGFRHDDGMFDSIGRYGHWWSSTAYSSTSNMDYFAWFRYIDFYYSNVSRIWFYKHNAYSVRCIKDN